MQISKWLLCVGVSGPLLTFPGCMSVLHYHELDGVTKTPFSAPKTDLGLAVAAITDPEIRGTIPGFVLFSMATIDTPMSLVADTILLPRDLRRSAAVRRVVDESTVEQGKTGE